MGAAMVAGTGAASKLVLAGRPMIRLTLASAVLMAVDVSVVGRVAPVTATASRPASLAAMLVRGVTPKEPPLITEGAMDNKETGVAPWGKVIKVPDFSSKYLVPADNVTLTITGVPTA